MQHWKSLSSLFSNKPLLLLNFKNHCFPLSYLDSSSLSFYFSYSFLFSLFLTLSFSLILNFLSFLFSSHSFFPLFSTSSFISVFPSFSHSLISLFPPAFSLYFPVYVYQTTLFPSRAVLHILLPFLTIIFILAVDQMNLFSLVPFSFLTMAFQPCEKAFFTFHIIYFFLSIVSFFVFRINNLLITPYQIVILHCLQQDNDTKSLVRHSLTKFNKFILYNEA